MRPGSITDLVSENDESRKSIFAWIRADVAPTTRPPNVGHRWPCVPLLRPRQRSPRAAAEGIGKKAGYYFRGLWLGRQAERGYQRLPDRRGFNAT